jgi:hypothetical protein
MHAVAEYLLHNKTDWQNGTMIALSVKDKYKLEYWKHKLDFLGIVNAAFYEPDIGNEMTAIVCVSDEEVFKSFKLVRK